MPAVNSYTDVPLSLDVIAGSDHAILIPNPTEDTIIACGDIGGSGPEGGALIIGLHSELGSGVTGIAFLAPDADPSQTSVSLFVTRSALARLAVEDQAPVGQQEAPLAVISDGGSASQSASTHRGA